MKLPYFEYRAPRSLDQALAQLAALGTDAKLLAGGQSLLPAMRYRLARPAVLLDISRLSELGGVGCRSGAADDAGPAGPPTAQPRDDGIQASPADAGGLRLPACLTHAGLARWQGPAPLAALVRAHAAQIAYPAVRSRGTLGGSIVHADPAGDWPLLFSALGAGIELASLRGTRRASLDGFIIGPLQSAIEIDEIATALHIDANSAGLTHWGRAKIAHRAGEYAMAAAVVLRRADGSWSCWAGALPAGPACLPGCAALLSQHPQPRTLPAGLLDCAREELADASPECRPVEIHRHAVNLVRAAAQAVGVHLE